MKRIVFYLITYACVTASVAGVIQIEFHKKPGNQPSSSTVTDVPEQKPVMKFIANAMDAKAVDLDAHVEIQKENETFFVDLNGEVSYEDLENIGVKATLNIDSSFVKTEAEIAYFAPYAYVYNDFIHLKVETNEFIKGVKELLPMIAPDMNINDEDSPFSNISTDDLLEKLQNMDFVETNDGELKGTLSIPNIVDVDLFLDKNYNLTKAIIPPTSIQGMQISLDANTKFLKETKISSPEKEYAFDDYTDITKVIENAYLLAKEKEFSLSLKADVEKENKRTSLTANAELDLINKEYYVDASLQWDEEKTDIALLYNPSAIYLSLNDALKGKLSSSNITRIKEIISEQLPQNEDGTSFIETQLKKLLEKEEFQKILAMDANDILHLFKEVSYIADSEIDGRKKLFVRLDANHLLEGNGNIELQIDMDNRQVSSLSIQNLVYQGYKLNLCLEIHAFESIPEIQEDLYQDYAPILTIYDQLMLLKDETQFAFRVNMAFQNGNKNYHITGSVQFELNKELEKNKGYVELNIYDNVKYHSLIMDYQGETMYFAYNNKMYAYMRVSTLKDMVKQIKELFQDDDPLLSGIHSLLEGSELSYITKIIQGDYSSLRPSLLKELSIENEKSHIILSKDAFGGEKDIEITIGYQNQELSSLQIENVSMGKDTMSLLNVEFSEYDDTKKLSSQNKYLDLNSLNILLRLGINTMHQRYYHIGGKATISLLNKEIDIDCYLLNDNGEVSMLINLDNIPVMVGINSLPGSLKASNSDYEGMTTRTDSKNRKASIYIHDGFVYLSRSETATFIKGGWYLLDTIDETYSKKIKVTIDTFMNQIFSYLFDFVLGMNDTISNTIKDQMTMPPVEEMKFDELINDISYQENDRTFKFDLNMSAITGNSSIESTTATIAYQTTDGVDHLASANLSMKISVSVVTMNINVNLSILNYGTAFDENTIIFDFCNKYSYQIDELFESHHK